MTLLPSFSTHRWPLAQIISSRCLPCRVQKAPLTTDKTTFTIKFFDRDGNLSKELKNQEIFKGTSKIFDLRAQGLPTTTPPGDGWLGSATCGIHITYSRRSDYALEGIFGSLLGDDRRFDNGCLLGVNGCRRCASLLAIGNAAYTQRKMAAIHEHQCAKLRCSQDSKHFGQVV